MKDKIILVLQQFGPLLPVEVASKSGLDSFMANAFLSELIADGKVLASKEKIAHSPVYYLPGQENNVQSKLSQINNSEQKTARTYAQSEVNVTPELRAKRDAFAQRLKEIESAEQKVKFTKPLLSPPPSPLPQPVSPTISETPPQPFGLPPPRPLRLSKPLFQHKMEPAEITAPKYDFATAPELKKEPQKRTFIDEAMDWLRIEGFDILDELNSKKKEMELIVKAHTDFGDINFYVRIKEKKTITEADLIAVYATAMEQKCPGVLITRGGLSKSAELYLDEKGRHIKVKQI